MTAPETKPLGKQFVTCRDFVNARPPKLEVKPRARPHLTPDQAARQALKAPTVVVYDYAKQGPMQAKRRIPLSEIKLATRMAKGLKTPGQTRRPRHIEQLLAECRRKHWTVGGKMPFVTEVQP